MEIVFMVFSRTFMYTDKYSAPGIGIAKDEINIAIEFMKNNNSEMLSVEEIAAAANLSISHFTYLCKTKRDFHQLNISTTKKYNRLVNTCFLTGWE